MTALDPEITITGLRGRVAELIDARDRLTRERDDARDEVVELCQERLQLRQAVAAAEDRRAGAVLRERQALAERDEARDLLRSAIAAEEQLRQQREAESAAYDLLENERNEAKAAVKRLTAKLEQANRGGAELGKTIDYLAGVMRLAAVTLTDHGPVAGMHVLFNHMAEAETLTEDEHAKAWAALQANEAAEKRTAEARAALDRVRSKVLADAIEAVCGLQIRDASRFAEHHGHGGWCKGGTAPDECHGAEAHATANRVLDTLRAIDGTGT